MQTVPAEFVAHLRPLMFVAGLGPEQQAQSSAQAASVQSPHDTSSDSTASAVGNALTAGTEQPAKEHVQNAVSPYATLIQSLRNGFTAQRSLRIYDTAAATSLSATPGKAAEFHVILVDKAVRFPPRKVRTQSGSVGPHSPISPFTPTSPLHPDGIMAPIWLRKHRELIPSVFVLVLRLYEFGQARNDINEPKQEELDMGPLEKEKLERMRDNELVNEVLNRKRTCSERGIKLAVVLLTSRKMLEETTLDARLSYIRRLSTLDSRASLFVLSPVAMQEVQNFVNSLQAELTESSIDYYREHGRRLRRKRSRPASTNLLGSQILPSTEEANGSKAGAAADRRLLSIQALNVRYEYKAAVFAEFRAELEVALKAYEDCYTALIELFICSYTDIESAPAHSGALLITGAPQLRARSKRWAEARVLADCISIKICKLYFYSKNSVLALRQYHQHLQRFQRLSERYWEMNNDSFEYWSWASKQHRMLADLVEMAVRHGYELPAPPGIPPLPGSHTRQLSHSPANCMQHPGYYYYIAGLCAMRRRDCYRNAASKIEGSASAEMPAALRHEGSVSHADQIIELFTKAYDYFKRERSTRITLYLAYLISDLHSSTSNHETSIKFDERIEKTYRKERWSTVLDCILSRSGQSALLKATTNGHDDNVSSSKLNKTLAIASLIERITLRGLEPRGQRSRTPRFRQMLSEATGAPDATGPTNEIVLRSDQRSLPLSCCCVFWRPQADLQSQIPFQIQLYSQMLEAEDLIVEPLSIHAVFSDLRQITINHCDGENLRATTGRYDLGACNASTQSREVKNLRFSSGCLVLQGTMSCGTPQLLKIEHLDFHARISASRFCFHLLPDLTQKPVWYSTIETIEPFVFDATAAASTCRFEPRKLRVTFTAGTAQQTYLNERFAIPLTVTNDDDVPVKVSLDALLHPIAEASTSSSVTDFLQLDGQADRAASISSAELSSALQPGDSRTTILFFVSRAVPGARHIDLSAIFQPLSPEQTDVSVTEISTHLTLDVTHPFFCDYKTRWRRCNASSLPDAVPLRKDPADVHKLDKWSYPTRAKLDIIWGALGPTNVEVVSVRMRTESGQDDIRITSSTVNPGDGQLPDTFEPEDPFTMIYDVEMSSEFDFAHAASLLLDISWRRPFVVLFARSGSKLKSYSRATSTIESLTMTSIPISALNKPLHFCDTSGNLEPYIIADAPSRAVLHRPFTASYYYVIPPANLSDGEAAAKRLPLRLSFYIEAASDNFVYSGLRKTDQLTVLPYAAQPSAEVLRLLATYTIVPVGNSGILNLPRFHANQYLDSPSEELARRRDAEPGDEDHLPPRFKELPVYARSSTCTDTSGPEDGLPTSGNAPFLPLCIHVSPH